MQPSGHSSWSTCTDSRSTTSPILKSSLSVFHIFGSLYLESNSLTSAAKGVLPTPGPTISFFKIKVGFKQKTGKNTGFIVLVLHHIITYSSNVGCKQNILLLLKRGFSFFSALYSSR